MSTTYNLCRFVAVAFWITGQPFKEQSPSHCLCIPVCELPSPCVSNAVQGIRGDSGFPSSQRLPWGPFPRASNQCSFVHCHCTETRETQLLEGVVADGKRTTLTIFARSLGGSSPKEKSVAFLVWICVPNFPGTLENTTIGLKSASPSGTHSSSASLTV